MRKNSNVKSAGYNKYYPEAVRRGYFTQRSLVEHIASHNIGVPKPMITAVIMQLSECIPELITQGVSVKLNDLGVFLPYIQSKGVTDFTKYNPSTDVVAVRMRFKPDSTDLSNLTAKTFGRRVSYNLEGVWDTVTTRLPDDTTTEVPAIIPYSDWVAKQE